MAVGEVNRKKDDMEFDINELKRAIEAGKYYRNADDIASRWMDPEETKLRRMKEEEAMHAQIIRRTRLEWEGKQDAGVCGDSGRRYMDCGDTGNLGFSMAIPRLVDGVETPKPRFGGVRFFVGSILFWVSASLWLAIIGIVAVLAALIPDNGEPEEL